MYTLEALVAHAREHSAFYAEHFRALPATGWRLCDLPLIQSSAYWRMDEGLQAWPVLTGSIEAAHVFKTGGTTGSGKVSVYTREEWRAFVTTFGRGMATLLQAGDRVANLFFTGDLYASLLFIHGALTHMEVPVCEYPFTGTIESSALADGIRAYGINVLAGVPAQLLRFAAYLDEQGVSLPQIRMVLYGGESVFADQLLLLHKVFPQAHCTSVGCASVDAGLLGASTADCSIGEHRCYDEDAIVEIIDESTGIPIDEPGRPGMVVLTNLQRKLMPLIRYPVGDLAAWVEPPGVRQRKFILMGRSSLGHRLRVGILSLFPDDIDVMIGNIVGPCRWQLLIGHTSGVDQLTLRMAHSGNDTYRDALHAALCQQIPGLQGLIHAGQLQLYIQWCATADLSLHPRTGKLARVLDQRKYQKLATGDAA
jgi:phenylacetate-CoA ligase